MSDVTALVAELRKRASAATPGNRIYRPNAHDDWGWVRLEASGDLLIVHSVARFDEHELNAHRVAKSDPVEADARLSEVCCPANITTLCDALTALSAENARLREALTEVETWPIPMLRDAETMRFVIGQMQKTARAALQEKKHGE